MSGAATSTDGGGGHVPAMLAEVLSALAPRDGERIIDGTFGAGGYAAAILERARCEVLGIDRDASAIAAGAALSQRYGGRLALGEGRFSELESHAEACGWTAVDGIVLDLGVSSMQLDQPERGFSFREDGPLDMRMGQEGPSAADVVNTFGERALADLLYAYGEERKSRLIARRIVAARKHAPITRTRALAELVAEALGGAGKRQAIHPATRTFQGLRIFVNRELHELAHALFAAERILRAGGRLVVVAFHSLEDRIVKRFLADRSRTEAGGSRHQPQQPVEPATFALLSRGAVVPSDAEITSNPRARSARLRAARRTEAPARGPDEAMLGLTNYPVADLPEDKQQ